MSGPQWISTTEYLQAWQVTSTNLREVAAWCGGRAGEVEQCVDFPDAREGISTAEVGDWVVRGVTGCFFSWPDDALREHYSFSGPPPDKPVRGVLTGETLRVTTKGQ